MKRRRLGSLSAAPDPVRFSRLGWPAGLAWLAALASIQTPVTTALRGDHLITGSSLATRLYNRPGNDGASEGEQDENHEELISEMAHFVPSLYPLCTPSVPHDGAADETPLSGLGGDWKDGSKRWLGANSTLNDRYTIRNASHRQDTDK